MFKHVGSVVPDHTLSVRCSHSGGYQSYSCQTNWSWDQPRGSLSSVKNSRIRISLMVPASIPHIGTNLIGKIVTFIADPSP